MGQGIIFGQVAGGTGIWTVAEHAALVVAIVGGFVGIMVARRKREIRRIEPQPFEVEGDIKVTPKGRRFNAFECDERHSEVKAKHAALLDKVNALDAYAHGAVGKIYERIDQVNARADMNLREAIKDLSSKIDSMPERLLTILQKTGQLKDHRND